MKKRIEYTDVFDLSNQYIKKYFEIINQYRQPKKYKPIGRGNSLYKYADHHIIPKCWYKANRLSIDNSSYNVIKLKLSDHFKVHVLLVQYYLSIGDKYFYHKLLTAIIRVGTTIDVKEIIKKSNLLSLQYEKLMVLYRKKQKEYWKLKRYKKAQKLYKTYVRNGCGWNGYLAVCNKFGYAGNNIGFNRLIKLFIENIPEYLQTKDYWDRVPYTIEEVKSLYETWKQFGFEYLINNCNYLGTEKQLFREFSKLEEYRLSKKRYSVKRQPISFEQKQKTFFTNKMKKFPNTDWSEFNYDVEYMKKSQYQKNLYCAEYMKTHKISN